MSVIRELANVLPSIIEYIVTGYAFIKTFHFVMLKQNTSDVEHILTSSLVIGYVYIKIANLIPFSISHEVDIVLIVLSALLLGYFIARLLRNKRIVYNILDFLKIRDTGNCYFWDDIMDDNYPMKVIVFYENMTYEGLIHNYESYSNEPHIVLGSYIVKDSTGKVIQDFSEDSTRITILDISNAISVDVLYYKDSDECEDLKNLCHFNKEFNQ